LSHYLFNGKITLNKIAYTKSRPTRYTFCFRELSGAFSCSRVYFRFIYFIYNLFYVRTYTSIRPALPVKQRQIRFCRLEAHNILSTDPFVWESSWPPFLCRCFDLIYIHIVIWTFSVISTQDRGLAKWRLPGEENDKLVETADSTHILRWKF